MGTITLVNTASPSSQYLRGNGVETLVAAQDVKIETGAVEMLNTTVPSGKIWKVEVWVNIVETDA